MTVAVQSRISRRTGVRNLRLLAGLLAAAGLACADDPRGSGDSVEAASPAPLPAVASPGLDTVPSDQFMWNLAAVQQALAARGIPAAPRPGGVSYPGLPNGAVVALDPGELQLFFLGDVAAADRALQQLRAAPPPATTPGAGAWAREAFVNGNMAVVMFVPDPAVGRRLREALTPAPGERNVDVQP